MTRAAFEQILERLQANPVLPSSALMHEIGHAQLQLWRQIDGARYLSIGDTDDVASIEDKNPVKRRKRQQSLTTRIRLVQKAGLSIAAVKPDGTIITTGKPGEPENDGWREVLQQ
jgi:hypothetical protein